MLKKMLFTAIAVGALAACAVQENPPPELLLFDAGKANTSLDTKVAIEDMFLDVPVVQCSNVILVGLGSDFENEQLNLNIGNTRADKIRKALEQKGFDRDRITVISAAKMDSSYDWVAIYPQQNANRAVGVYMGPPKNWYDDFRCKQLLDMEDEGFKLMDASTWKTAKAD